VNKFKDIKMTLKQHYAPDADVIRAIKIGIKSVKHICRIHIQHIKGHQDKKNKKLSFEEELNVKADNLATIGLNKKKVHHVQLPGNEVYLLINGKPVTSKHNKALRDSFHAIRMHSYFQETYGWHNKTVDTIWWQVHGKALLQFKCGQRTTIQKFIHRRIACNKRENKYNTYRSPMCRQCPNVIECTDHIIKCAGCNSRSKERTTYLKHIQNQMIIMGTNTTTIRVIIAHLQAWLDDKPMPDLIEIAPEASEYLKKTVATQSKIGWDQWFRGRISIQWGEMYNNDIANPPFPLYRPSAARWGKQIIKATWNFVLNSWQIRNNIEHDNDGEPIKRSKEKIIERILWIQKQISPEKEHPFKHVTKEDIMRLPLENTVAMAEQIQIEWKSP
jgi:hypothetical protein